MESCRLRSDSEIEPDAMVIPHLLNISQLRKPAIGWLARVHFGTHNPRIGWPLGESAIRKLDLTNNFSSPSDGRNR